MKQYIQPTFEVSPAEVEEQGGSGKYKLPYGIAKGMGLNTDGMTPREVWDMLKGKGINPQQAYKDLEKHAQQETQKEKIEVVDNSAIAIENMVNDDRCVYSKKFTKEHMLEDINSGTPEMKDTTVSLFNNDRFGYNHKEKGTAFYSGFNKVCIKDNENDDCYTKGGVFYHETWHAIDNNYGSFQLQQSELIDIYGFVPTSSDLIKSSTEKHTNLSTHYKLSTGKTLKDHLLEEIKQTKWNDIKTEIQNDIDAIYNKFGKDKTTLEDNYRSAMKGATDEYLRVYKETKDRKLASKAESDFNANNNDIKLYIEIKENISSFISKKWGDISDIYSGACKDKLPRIANMGHKTSYWKKGGSNAMANEVFAECASAKATNKESYEVLSKYFPNTMKGFEEIYNKLKNGEIKPKGRARYEK